MPEPTHALAPGLCRSLCLTSDLKMGVFSSAPPTASLVLLILRKGLHLGKSSPRILSCRLMFWLACSSAATVIDPG